MVDDRKLSVLKAIVSDYVSSREPVGSKALVERHNLGVSPATVRNDMASLEEEGYIAQPHTSAGRVPTDKGYRLFVDRLATVKPLSGPERRAISTFLSGAADVDDIVIRTVRLLAEITQQVAIVQYPVLDSSTVRHVELVSMSTERVLVIAISSTGRIEQRTLEIGDHTEDDLAEWKQQINRVVEGQQVSEAVTALGVFLDQSDDGRSDDGQRDDARHAPGLTACGSAVLDMLSTGAPRRVVVGGVPNLTRFGPEFLTTMGPVLEALEEQVVLLRLLGESTSPEEVTVRIGQENPYTELQTTSVVSAGYGASDDAWAALGIVGPTRMDYPSAMGSVRAVARYLGRFLNEG